MFVAVLSLPTVSQPCLALACACAVVAAPLALLALVLGELLEATWAVVGGLVGGGARGPSQAQAGECCEGERWQDDTAYGDDGPAYGRNSHLYASPCFIRQPDG
jgi:hypothetical protein